LGDELLASGLRIAADHFSRLERSTVKILTQIGLGLLMAAVAILPATSLIPPL
jgi:hypothetical protein